MLAAHLLSLPQLALPWWATYASHGGYFGVELFFVLSGFLIGTILVRQGGQLARPDALATFYLRRWFRTLPLFFLFLLLNLLLEWGLHRRAFPPTEIVGHAFFLRNMTGPDLLFFGESWSLAIEEWFYLLFPLALFLCLQGTRRFNRVLLGVALAFLLFSTLGRLFTAAAPEATWTEWQRKPVLLRFDALMAGVVAAWIALRFPAGWQRWRRPCAFLGIAGAAVLYCLPLHRARARDELERRYLVRAHLPFQPGLAQFRPAPPPRLGLETDPGERCQPQPAADRPLVLRALSFPFPHLLPSWSISPASIRTRPPPAPGESPWSRSSLRSWSARCSTVSSSRPSPVSAKKRRRGWSVGGDSAAPVPATRKPPDGGCKTDKVIYDGAPQFPGL